MLHHRIEANQRRIVRDLLVRVRHVVDDMEVGMCRRMIDNSDGIDRIELEPSRKPDHLAAKLIDRPRLHDRQVVTLKHPQTHVTSSSFSRTPGARRWPKLTIPTETPSTPPGTCS